LCSDIYNANIGKEVVVGDICSLYELDITNRFVVKNVRDALRKLETENKVKVISGRKQKCRSGILNMPNEARVIFQ